jgi:DNA-binding SARP family transcriptional activator
VPGARLRALLIALALEPGHAVPKATLVDWIWGERPPSDAANALQRLASRLRKALPEGGRGADGRLPVDGGPDAVDAVRFERLVARPANDEDPRRVRLLREALACGAVRPCRTSVAGQRRRLTRRSPGSSGYA